MWRGVGVQSLHRTGLSDSLAIATLAPDHQDWFPWIVALIVAFLLIRVFLTPYIYSQFRQLAVQAGRNPPPFLDLIRDTIRDLPLGACYLTAPFLVYMSIRRGRDSKIKTVEAPIP